MITGVAEQVGERMAFIVYVDAFVPANDVPAAAARSDRNWTVYDIASGHDLPNHKPDELTAILEASI